MEHKTDTRTELHPNNTKEGEFGVKEISVMFATIGGFEVPSTASMDEIEEALGRLLTAMDVAFVDSRTICM